VLENLEEELRVIPGGFYERFKTYLLDERSSRRERRLLKAAHFLATQWEFNIIYRVCPFVYGIEKIKEEIEGQIEDHYDLIGVQKISLGRKTAGFVDLCGQLRFQKRWSQSPRVPETSVLGHMLIVAALTFLALQECSVREQRQRLRNGFLAGLFHDLPEVLTRDITSPVKGAVAGLEAIIKEYERIQLDEKLLPLVPHGWHRELRYYLDDEFANKAVIDGRERRDLSFEELGAIADRPKTEPVDGELIRCCDHLAAFIEASLSTEHGITSKHLAEGIERLLAMYRDRQLGPLDFGAIFRQFTPGG
jgi:putative hydrolase of HD superfamily